MNELPALDIVRMNHNASNAILNDLLVELHRSLVQYAAESWLWSTEQAGELRAAVLSLAERQRQDTSRLVYFLMGRGHIIDFGMYPFEYTSLHYVALEYLYQQLLENQRALTEMAESCDLQLQANDPHAAGLVRDIARSEREGLERLAATDVPGKGQAPAWMK
jgi:hypothetical protein